MRCFDTCICWEMTTIDLTVTTLCVSVVSKFRINSLSTCQVHNLYTFIMIQTVKNLPAMWVQFLGWEDRRWRRDCLETVIHASIPSGRTPRTEEPDRPQSAGSQRVGHG